MQRKRSLTHFIFILFGLSIAWAPGNTQDPPTLLFDVPTVPSFEQMQAAGLIPNLPRTDPHWPEAFECMNNLRTALASFIEEANRTPDSSLNQVIRHQADMAMLRVGRAFLRLREKLNGLSSQDPNFTTQLNTRLRNTTRPLSTTVGRLTGTTLDTQTMNDSLYRFYSYIQHGPDAAGESAFATREARRQALKSLQLFSFKQENDQTVRLSGTSRTVAVPDEYFEITDQDVFIIDQLFDNYRPGNRDRLAGPDDTFFDTIMRQLQEHFQGQAEAIRSDLNSNTRQLVARGYEHATIAADNYPKARENFVNFIKGKIRDYLAAVNAATSHPCKDFLNRDGTFKREFMLAEGQGPYCYTAQAWNDLVLSSPSRTNFERILNFMNGEGSGFPVNATPNYDPNMHAKEVYHNLYNCSISQKPNGDFEVCLDFYVEHLHTNEERNANFFFNANGDIDRNETFSGKARFSCERINAQYSRQTEAETINGERCIDRPLHFTGAATHNQRFNCSREPKILVNLGDTPRTSITMYGTSEPLDRTGPTQRVLPEGATRDVDYEEDPVNPERNPIMNRPLDLSQCRGAGSGTGAGSWSDYQARAQAVTGVEVVEVKTYESYIEVKARALPERTPARRGTYRWSCKEPSDMAAFVPDFIPTATTEFPVGTTSPCASVRTSDNPNLHTGTGRLYETIKYPRLMAAYKVQADYFSTIQAANRTPGEGTIAPYRGIRLRLVPGARADGMQEVKLQAYAVGYPGDATAPEIELTETERRDIEATFAAGTMTVPNCGPEGATTLIQCQTLRELSLSTNSGRIFSDEGYSFRVPIQDNAYPISVSWSNTDYSPVPRTAETSITPSPFRLRMEQVAEGPQSVTCKPVLEGPADQLASVAATLRFSCQGSTLPENCPTTGANRLVAQNNTDQVFERLRETYTVNVVYTDTDGEERGSSTTCSVGQARGSLITLSVALAEPPSPEGLFFQNLTPTITPRMENIAPFEALPGTQGIFYRCPDAPEGTPCKTANTAYTSGTPVRLPRPSSGSYTVNFSYVYSNTDFGTETATERISVQEISLRAPATTSPESISIAPVLTPNLTATDATYFTRFEYQCLDLPDGSARPEKCGQPVIGNNPGVFPRLDGAGYRVKVVATLNGRTLEETVPIPAKQEIAYTITPTQVALEPQQAVYTATVAPGGHPATWTKSWVCEGEHKPANCEKATVSARDNFPRLANNRTYQIRALLKDGETLKAQSPLVTIPAQAQDVWAIEVSEDLNEPDHAKAKFRVKKVKKNGRDYPMQSNDQLQWSWEGNGTATGTEVSITRKDDSFDATIKLMIHNGTVTEEKASETVSVDPKAECPESEMDSFGRCPDREPAEDIPFEVPPLEDLPPSPAPPRQMPIILPRTPFYQMVPGFA